MTFSWAQVDKLAAACLGIAASAADSQDFVTVRSLLKRFDTTLMLRPLLVEAMLCEVVAQNSDRDASAVPRWTLLVDSDKYAITNDAVLAETILAPLPERFRNTVAHELAHSLAFRGEEFGVKLILDDKRRKKGRELEVQDIERYTERMSPLLLVPDAALNRHFSTSTQMLTVHDLARIRKSLGVSRHVLINRLNLLEEYSPHFLTRTSLFNVAMGIGKWASNGDFLLSGWPIYSNFSRNITPAFLHSARLKKSLPLSEVFGGQPATLLNGRTMSMHVPAGVEKYPDAESLEITFSLEQSTRGSARPSFFLVTLHGEKERPLGGLAPPQAD